MGICPWLRCCPRGGESPGVARLLEIQRLDREEKSASRDRERQVTLEMRPSAGNVKNIRKFYVAALLNHCPANHLMAVLVVGSGASPVIESAPGCPRRNRLPPPSTPGKPQGKK